MSRIGKQPISVPSGVEISVVGRDVQVKGPKGELGIKLMRGLNISVEEGNATIVREAENASTQESYGLTRTLVANMVQGVSSGYERQLEIHGVGYRASVTGRAINLSLGYSHPINYDLPEGIEAKIERNIITISGHNKQLVGQVAAELRALRKPEPYKGKGIRYVGEHIRRKAGKAATAKA